VGTISVTGPISVCPAAPRTDHITKYSIAAPVRGRASGLQREQLINTDNEEDRSSQASAPGANTSPNNFALDMYAIGSVTMSIESGTVLTNGLSVARRVCLTLEIRTPTPHPESVRNCLFLHKTTLKHRISGSGHSELTDPVLPSSYFQYQDIWLTQRPIKLDQETRERDLHRSLAATMRTERTHADPSSTFVFAIADVCYVAHG
jgi:hypothetical protein